MDPMDQTQLLDKSRWRKDDYLRHLYSDMKLHYNNLILMGL